MDISTCGARQGISRACWAIALAALLLCPLVLAPTVAPSLAQTRERRTAKPPKAAKPAKPPQQPKLLDPAKVDSSQLDPDKIDPKRLDARHPNSWIALALAEMRGGNFGGALASLERATELGETRRDKAAVATAAVHMGRIYAARVSFMGVSAKGVAAFTGRPGDQLARSIESEFEKAKGLFEKAIALHKALGRNDAVAADHARLGDLYTIGKDYDRAQAALTEALAINKALQRKQEMADNYRDLADTHRYDLDQAEALLKEAVALHEALGLKEEMAIDYERLGSISSKRGELFEAERFYKQGLAGASGHSKVNILKALERLYADRNDPGQAAEMKEAAAALDNELRKDAGRMILFSRQLGMFVSASGAKGQLVALERVVPLEKKLGHWPGLATSYALLGLHYGQLAKMHEDRRDDMEGRAEAVLSEALVLNRVLKREEALAHAYRELARIRDRRDKLDDVAALLQDALPLHKKLGDEREMAQLYYTLGYQRKERSDIAQACAYWRNGAVAFPSDQMLVEVLNSSKCAASQ